MLLVLGGVAVMFDAWRDSTRRQRPSLAAVPRGIALSQTEKTEVSVSVGGRLRLIPRSFLGISTEYWTLPVDEHHSRLFGRILSMIHVHGDGPVVLRIGGDSSDHALFDPVLHDTPRWAFDITPAWIHQTARIIRDNQLLAPHRLLFGARSTSGCLSSRPKLGKDPL